MQPSEVMGFQRLVTAKFPSPGHRPYDINSSKFLLMWFS